MRRVFGVWLVLWVAFLLTACTSKPIIEGDDVKSLAANAIAQAEVSLTRGYRAVVEQAAAGVLSGAELKEAVELLDEAGRLLDKAQEVYRLGNFGAALKDVQDADKALAFIEAQIAKKLRGGRV